LPFGLYFFSQARANIMEGPFTPGIICDIMISPEFNGDRQIVFTPVTESQTA